MILARIISCVGIILIGLFLPWWVFAVGAGVYAFVFSPYELLVIGLSIDAQFGDASRGVWYLYTLIAVLAGFASLSARPFLRFYDSL